MDAEQKTPEHIPNDVIEAILKHIPFDGWSIASLNMAAADCGLSEVEMHNLFPAGIFDAMAAYGSYADQNMITAFYGQRCGRYCCHAVLYENPLSYYRSDLNRLYHVKRLFAEHWLCLPGRKMQSWHLNFCIKQLMRCGARLATLQLIITFTPKGRLYRAVYSATLPAFLSDNSADFSEDGSRWTGG